MDTSSDSNASSYPATPNAAILPPSIDELRAQLADIHTSANCLQFFSTLDAHTQDLDNYHFDNLGSRNQYGVLLYSLLEQARSNYSALKANEMKYDNELHLDVLKSWGRVSESRTLTPPSRTSTPRPRHRPPPPITIDNVEHTAQLLKRLQNLTNQKLQGRVIGRGLRVYPETPTAYHQIRNLINSEKLEAFTHELSAR
ncbi:hypothetical protein TNIN_350211 [Trichonephila inaurata madagascariensis]|uniref:Uncharacterized protein n=1 Tax=Trichonephila inaurata madagascariensis TaxID=2747483 RepID=A0A8X7C7H5_9ARAC|nr:hypothetical protein TNIN_350211 [Trichonephila inaurata madagascariensis]